MSSSVVARQKIEQVVISIIRDLMNNKTPILERENLMLIGRKQKSYVEWAYKRCRRNFVVLLHLMENIHEILLKQTIRTKRELYYANTALYGKQNNLDIAVSNLCEILKVPRAMLNVEATAKGLLAGNVTWTGPQNEKFNASDFNSTGMLIPTNLDGHHNFQSQAKFILVVEKDAIFQKLLNYKIFDKLGPFILITGKGYPDYGTRKLLRRLTGDLGLKSFVMVDNDPHGIEIAAIYKWGSYGQVQKANNDSNFISELTVPDIIWIGLYPSDVEGLGFSRKSNPLNERDNKKLISVQNRLSQQAGSESWLREVMLMKQRGTKAELEALDSGFLTEFYIRNKVAAELKFGHISAAGSRSLVL